MMAERLDVGYTRFSQVLALVLVGWFASSWWYQTGAFEKVRRAADTLPAVAAEEHCEHWRADKSAEIAKQAIISAMSDYVEIPRMGAIPKDCPHPQIKK